MLKILAETIILVESLKTAKEFAYKHNITQDIFDKFNALDTTPTKKLICQILKWYILNVSLKDKVEELKKEIDTFIKFDGGKIRQAIETFKTYSEFKEFITPFLNDKTKSEKKDELFGQYEKVFENDNMIIILPRTLKASCLYGANTKWCITQADKYHFDDYVHGAKNTFYFCLSKLMKFPSNPFHKIAVVVRGNTIESAYNTFDDSIDVETYLLPWLKDNEIPMDIFKDSVKIIDNDKYSEYLVNRHGPFNINDEESYNVFNKYVLPGKIAVKSGIILIDFIEKKIDGAGMSINNLTIHKGDVSGFNIEHTFKIEPTGNFPIKLKNINCKSFITTNYYFDHYPETALDDLANVNFNVLDMRIFRYEDDAIRMIKILKNAFIASTNKFDIDLMIYYSTTKNEIIKIEDFKELKELMVKYNKKLTMVGG